MQDRKLNVTMLSPYETVRKLRTAFDRHIDGCTDCQPSLCWQGQTAWRALCLEALKQHSRPAPVTVVPLGRKDGA